MNSLVLLNYVKYCVRMLYSDPVHCKDKISPGSGLSVPLHAPSCAEDECVSYNLVNGIKLWKLICIYIAYYNML